MMKKLLALTLLAIPALAGAQSLTLTNLKGPVAKACKVTEAKTIAELWRQLAACNQAAPVPAPTPMPASTGLVEPIPSNFDTSKELVPAWESGAIPVSAAPDIVGAFRFLCTPGQVKADDPIVYPGQPGKSHLHRFFGNTLTDASSTYASLRAAGDSTCMSKLNRSAYWQPEMMNGASGVPPLFWVIYYKRYPATSPFCKSRGEQCVAIPPGLKFIFGYDMLTGKPATGSTFWQCVNPDGVTVINPHSATMTQALNGCAVGWQLEVRSEAPECWNGTALDSANHRDHVAYMTNDPNTGQPSCDKAHAKIMPQFTLAAFWTVTADAGKWALSSDAMMGAEPGRTFHSDFFAAWDPPTEDVWTANCIDKLLNCSGGDLGNGTQLRAR